MPLTYRGVSYDPQPTPPSDRPFSGKYRGIAYNSNPAPAIAAHSTSLTYRGVPYTAMTEHPPSTPAPCPTATLDIAEILEYGLRSQLVYSLSQSEWQITAHLGWRLSNQSKITFKEVRRSQVNTLVEVDDRRQIQWIAVRGSQNLRNWLLNLRYMQRPFTKTSKIGVYWWICTGDFMKRRRKSTKPFCPTFTQIILFA